MSRVCAICGKAKMTGNNVSHSKIKTKRVLSANLRKVSAAKVAELCPEKNDLKKDQYVCTKCLKGSAKDKK